MPDLSKIKIRPREKRYGYKLITPPQYHSEFLALVNKLVPYYKDLIDDMIKSADY